MGHDVAVTASTRARPDAAVVAAVDLARDALIAEVGEHAVGDHSGHRIEGDRLATQLFDCRLKGYVGWHWSVTVVRASRQKTVTVDEVVLIPGGEAIVAPTWVPWRERIQPGDMSPGDLLPVDDDDPRLVPTWMYGEDALDADDRAQIREIARDLGSGRSRTLSIEGRDAAAERWYFSDHGPSAAIAKSATDACDSCGFLVPLSGPLSLTFGVCANGDANDDGQVVTVDHGCGAHSEIKLARKHQPQALPDHVLDTLEDLESF